jgi:hypothetical protein
LEDIGVSWKTLYTNVFPNVKHYEPHSFMICMS